MLNNIIDQASALTGLISTQTIDNTPTPSTDYVMYYDPSGGGTLKRCLIQNLPNGVTSIVFTMPTAEFTVTNTLVSGVSTLTVAWKTGGFAANKVLAAPAGSSGAPSFRLLVPADITPLHQDIALATIDWSLGNVFAKVMTGNHTFDFTNVRDGQSIIVRLQQQSPTGGFFAHWTPGVGNTLLWLGGVLPTMSIEPGRKDVYFFTAIGATIYGYSLRNFA